MPELQSGDWAFLVSYIALLAVLALFDAGKWRPLWWSYEEQCAHEKTPPKQERL